MNRFSSPFSELDALRRGIDQLFADTWPGSLGRGSLFLPGRSARGYPLINLYGDPEKYVVEAFAPGLDLGSLDVSVQGNLLTLSGEKKAVAGVKPEAFHRNERSAGKFVRSYQLDCEIDEANVNAEYKNGILTITLPKSERAKPKKIAVNVK
ncbi:MAG: Hsp20/alpha crystallin family protein [Candidatus Latescibacterota bacterium]|jgi:HSP20 family protein